MLFQCQRVMLCMYWMAELYAIESRDGADQEPISMTHYRKAAGKAEAIVIFTEEMIIYYIHILDLRIPLS